MKINYLFLLSNLAFSQVSFFQSGFANEEHSAFVTYDLTPNARLGDNLICYLHAKWVSYRYEIPLLYTPFPHSDAFAFDELEKRLSPKKNMKKIVLRNGSDLIHKILGHCKKKVLFVVPYFPESSGEREKLQQLSHNDPFFSVDWKDENFRAVLREMLKPKTPLKLTDCPHDKVSVAIHVRTGRGFDPESYKKMTTLAGKLPPPQFYLDALDAVCKLLPDQEIYFHIFTDDPEPHEIVNLIDEHLKTLRSAPYAIGFRNSKNNHDLNILEDMFSMMQFDCLIRPESNFSIIPSLLKDYKLLIHPLRWETRASQHFFTLNVVTNNSIGGAGETLNREMGI